MWEQLPKEIKALAVVFVIALIFGAGVLASNLIGIKNTENALLELPSAAPEMQDGEKTAAAPMAPEKKNDLVVHVSGAVANPGVYSLPEGSRVNDAVLLADPLSEAELDALNLAAPLLDGQKVAVPSKGEAGNINIPEITSSTASAALKVNLNTAGLAELDTLPGIGPATAQKIIDYRQEHGGFRGIEELEEVSGIGPKKFEGLKDLVSIY